MIYLFAAILALFGIGFVTFKQPVYSALSFTALVLVSCVLFVLSASPFLAAATMVVYAGATIIVFLFVLMFAQRSKLQSYDVNLNHPIIACFVGGGLLGLLISGIRSLPHIQGQEMKESKVADLGKLMYSDYLWTVELAGLLLLVATIAAIVIAQDQKTSSLSKFDELLQSKIDAKTQSGSNS
jgi:NADH-quinone oxidoreductase subunit J